MPLLGLGVYQNDNPKEAIQVALEAGYRHIDSAQMYRNESQVGETVKESGIPREDIFISERHTRIAIMTTFPVVLTRMGPF